MTYDELADYCKEASQTISELDYKNRMLVDERNQLKKQLEETNRKLFLTKNELDMRQKSIDNKLNQQKEFIKFLEDNYKETQDIWYIKILQKYKETIGDDK